MTRAETRFLLSAKRTSPFKLAGASVQSATGSRGVRISGSNAGYNMFRGSMKGSGYPIHSPVSPSRPQPCVTICAIIFQMDSSTADAHNSAASSRLNWRPPADLKGFVRFAERRNLVSARVPSHFKRSLMLDTSCSEVVWRVLATHSILQFPLHFPTSASPCAITFQLDSTTADAHTSAASSRLNWRPRRFKWTRPFRRKTKSGFCACAITF